MNKISNDLMSSSILEQDFSFQNILSRISQENNTSELQDKNIGQENNNIVNDEVLTEMILQQMISDQTIAMLKTHQENMKEILDED